MSRPSLRAEAKVVITTASNGAITLSVPIRLRRRSGRELVMLDRDVGMRPWDAVSTPLQQALAASAGRRGIRFDERYIARHCPAREHRSQLHRADVELTLLAPNVIEAILDDTLPDHIRMNDLAINPPMLWEEQLRQVGRLKDVYVHK